MKKITLSILLTLLSLNYLLSNVTLPQIICNHMVVQRNAKINIWGWAEKGENITVTFNDLTKEVKATNGTWLVSFPEMKAGGPYKMLVKGKNKIEISDIMVGDVWVCSGQSNMEFHFENSIDYEKDLLNTPNNNIRLFKIKKKTSSIPLNTLLETQWEVCDTASVKDFSAVGYYFGKNLQKEIDIPIGLIGSNWGGTIVETWMSNEAINSVQDLLVKARKIEAQFDMSGETIEERKAKYDALMKEFGETKGGLVNGKALWASPNLDESTWKEMNLPRLWENDGLVGLDGVVWYRKTITLKKDQINNDLTLNLGTIDDGDITYVNGKIVGETKNAYDEIRKYTIPASFLNEGKNVIAIRVTDFMGGGGLYGANSEMNISGENVDIPLSGIWKFRISPIDFALAEAGASPNSSPSLLFNAMIHPILKYNIKGAIWYQGESNANYAYAYRTFFPNMIKDWRKNWNNPEMPFMFVQLANFKKKDDKPVESMWAELRDAQLNTLKLSKTGMAVIIDIGEAYDIHPKNKKDVGYRLSLAARKQAYGEDIVYTGPVYKSIEINGDKAILSFTEIGGGLVTKNKYGYLQGFTIAGADKVWHWAQATIKGDKVVVSSHEVPDPVAVRYGWSNNPDADLFNAEGLPATPFRTDDWKMITE